MGYKKRALQINLGSAHYYPQALEHGVGLPPLRTLEDPFYSMHDAAA